MTFSEQLFEDYCQRSGIHCRRIAEESNKTPDYELLVGGQRLIVEVKEISRNKHELESDRLLAERGYGLATRVVPGERVRGKISRSGAQIRVLTGGVLPSMLVLFDRGSATNHLDSYHLRTAMYGIEQIHLAVPPLGLAGRLRRIGMSYGGRRKMTRTDNNSISAIGVLWTPGPNAISLYVYHNKYAAVPLQTSVFSDFASAQFELGDEIAGRTADWRECTVGVEARRACDDSRA
jgi:hypothetical protein